MGYIQCVGLTLLSNVTSMECMFYDAHAFNGDLSTWDTSNMTFMEGMLQRVRAFNGDLSRWDTDMCGMFRGCPH